MDANTTVTTGHLRDLLTSEGERPVLYIDENGNLDVWVEAYVPTRQVAARRSELVDDLGGPDHPDGPPSEGDLEELIPGIQATVDEIATD